MPYKIDKARPLPPRVRKPKYPFDNMEIGDSFFVPTGPFTNAQERKWATIRTNISVWRRKTNQLHVKFTYRFVTEADVIGHAPNRQGVRVWRVADGDLHPLQLTGPFTKAQVSK